MKKKKIFGNFALKGTLGLILPLSYSCADKPSIPENPNVLFIIVDDLRDELNCYGASHIHSPHIDALADDAVLFRNTYCNIPVCGASRASLMTGLRPTANIFRSYNTRANEDVPDMIALSQLFKDNGYTTISNGKVFHHADDRYESWTELWNIRENFTRDYLDPVNIRLDDETERGYPYEWADVPDNAYIDGKTAEKSIKDLRKLKETGEPFFLAAGFLKPHLPFNAPVKYWDIYPEESIKLPENYRYFPHDAPEIASINWGELRRYYAVPDSGPVDDEMAYKLIHGYYACVSYMDRLIGDIISELKSLDLYENTIIVVMGDHGWNLGEHGLWVKHCLFSTSLRTAMIIRVPWLSRGKVAESIVEFIDIYPTLCDLASIEKPSHLQGESLAEILEDPSTIGKNYAVAVYQQGINLSTPEYSYSEWLDRNQNLLGRMLYDRVNDPDENFNISEKQENQDLVSELSRKLHTLKGAKFWNSQP